jgi:hypothetical protein
VKHGQFFLNGSGRTALAELALALHDFRQIKSHFLPPRNCSANRITANHAVCLHLIDRRDSIFDVRNPQD